MCVSSGCGVSESDFEKVKNEKEELKNELDKCKVELDNKKEELKKEQIQVRLLEDKNKNIIKELDECKFGAERIIIIVENAYKEKKYSLAKQNIDLLNSKHPESVKNSEFKNLLKIIEEEELKEKTRKEAEEKERIRLANLDNTGMWSINYITDKYGDATNIPYIKNSSFIRGTFSNSATNGSDLNVTLLIKNSFDISIILYQYGDKQVKYFENKRYLVSVKDKAGNDLELSAMLYPNSDKLCLDKNDSKILNDVLAKGGPIKFNIVSGLDKYNFIIQNTEWYGNAYKKLEETIKTRK